MKEQIHIIRKIKSNKYGYIVCIYTRTCTYTHHKIESQGSGSPGQATPDTNRPGRSEDILCEFEGTDGRAKMFTDIIYLFAPAGALRGQTGGRGVAE